MYYHSFSLRHTCAIRYTMFNSDPLCEVWSFLNEYHDFCSLARNRKKLEEQLRHANISLTYVPWKLMVRTLLCRDRFSDEQLKEMTTNTEDCNTAVDIDASQTTVNLLLENDQEDEQSLTETWFEIDALKQRLQRAIEIVPTSRHARKEMLYKILGYPTGKTILIMTSDLYMFV
jgi:hypothetical protein